MINLSNQTLKFPCILKIAKVNLMYKKADTCIVSNNRSVSILPIMRKIFEKAFLDRTMSFMDMHHQLSSDQFGFKKGKSTTDAVVSKQPITHLQVCFSIFPRLSRLR